MLKLFLGRNINGQFAVLLVFLTLIITFFTPVEIVAPTGFAPLYALFYSWAIQWPIIAHITTAIVFILLTLGIPIILQFYDLSSRLSYMGGLSFLMLTLLFPDMYAFHPALLSGVMYVIVFKLAFDLESREDKNRTLFALGFFSGLSTLIYFPSIYLFAFLLIVLIYMQLFKLRQIVLVAVHFLLPLFFYFTYLFWIDGFESEWLVFIDMFNPSVSFTIADLDVLDGIRISVFVLLIITTVFRHLGIVMSKLIQIRRFSMIVLWGVILGLLSLVWIPSFEVYHLFTTVIPLSMLLSFAVKDLKHLKVPNYALVGLILFELLLIFYSRFYVIT